jgi:hypothetical protein
LSLMIIYFDKPVGDGAQEVLGGGTARVHNIMYRTLATCTVPVTLQGLNTELVYFGI